MFDAEYFKELLNDTSKLLRNKEIHDNKKLTKEEQIRIESNITALEILAQEIEDEDLRKSTLARISNICKIKEDVPKVLTKKRIEVTEDDECKYLLEKDLIRYSKSLKERAKEFKDQIDLDNKVLNETEDVFMRNITGTEANLANLRKTITFFSPFRILIISTTIFFLMYLLIRFF